ncbi:MAG: tetratricopeptide repeat protein [Candidatus Marinimicrobia bacterium]|nr:tetratricopeptide repeat protein [Candidatus Neomarinimicrobiota bacterium]
MFKSSIAILLISALFIGCSGSKDLEQDVAQVKRENFETDSVLVMLDSRLQEFSKEVKAMRETYNENHISLENLYKANAVAKKNLEELGARVAEEAALRDSAIAESTGQSEEQIAGLQAEQDSLRHSLSGLTSSIQGMQFQVDSIYAMIDIENLAVMEENMLQAQEEISRLDSSFSEFQLTVADHMMSAEDQLATLERHAKVQDSANYDILSQLVLLENKIITLTNSFNELMAMPSPAQSMTAPPMQSTQPDYTQPAMPNAAKMDYETYKQNYIDALSAYQNGNHMQAIDAFRVLLMNDSSNDYSDNVQYWIGECYYALDDYARAIDEFTKVFQFQDSNKYSDAQFKIAKCYLSSGNNNRGYAELERLIEMYPNSDNAAKAKRLLASR